MSDTPPLTAGAWVDITRDLPSGTASPPIPFGSENDYMRMLKEAQRETSCRTSARVSPITSALMSHNSPKSPPNSPNVEMTEHWEDFSDVYINRLQREPEVGFADFLWDWSSRPNILPPKEWKRHRPGCTAANAPHKKEEGGLGKYRVVTLVITNIISLIIGAGIGVWFFRGSNSAYSETTKVFI